MVYATPFNHASTSSKPPLHHTNPDKEANSRHSTINISRIQLAEDFLIVDDNYPPSAWTNTIYVSDLPKSWSWNSQELRPMYNIHIIDQLRQLKHLETVIANNGVFLSTLMIQELVDGAHPSLKYVDFEHSGMARAKPWAIKGTREEVVKIIREMERDTPRSPDPRGRFSAL